jgi:hypothetical protein
VAGCLLLRPPRPLRRRSDVDVVGLWDGSATATDTLFATFSKSAAGVG